jgi:hypothetical protein
VVRVGGGERRAGRFRGETFFGIVVNYFEIHHYSMGKNENNICGFSKLEIAAWSDARIGTNETASKLQESNSRVQDLNRTALVGMPCRRPTTTK